MPIRSLSIFLGFLLSLVCFSRETLGQEPTVVGRFQIYAATFYDQHEQKDVRALFKIDTATGVTWQYQVFTMKGRPGNEINGATVAGWVLVDADPLQTINRLQKK